MPVRRVLVAALAFAVALGAAACRGGGGGQPTGVRAATTSTTIGAPTADQALARRIGLTLADLPAGWSEKPRSDPADDPAAAQRLRQCLHMPHSARRPPLASVDSPDFQSPDGASHVASYVGVAQQRDRITRGMNLIAGAGVAQCLAERLDALYARDVTLPAGTRVGEVSARRESYPTIGDRTVAYQLEVPVIVQGRSLNVYVDVIAVQQGRVDVVLTASDVFAPAAVETSRSLIERMLARAAGA